jgi:RNA polymerase sigma-70 factor, ECF subfamily
VEEIAILAQIKAGNIRAYEELFNTYYHPLCQFASKIINDKERGRDLVQDLFVTLYAQRASLDIHTSIRSYLFRALNNLCLNELRQLKSHIRHHEEIKRTSAELSFQDDVTLAELQSRLRMAVESLPGQCGRIFQMSRFAGKKNAEIAQELGISIRTVETQVSKALAILRTQLIDFLPVLLLTAFF